MQLSTQQIAFFQTFGFLIVRSLFTSNEVRVITANFERTLAECAPSGRNAPPSQLVLGPIQHLPEMCALLDHPSILGVAGGLLGDDFNYAMGDGRCYSGDT